MPSQQLLTEMGRFNEELVKAGHSCLPPTVCIRPPRPPESASQVKIARSSTAPSPNQGTDRRLLALAGQITVQEAIDWANVAPIRIRTK